MMRRIERNPILLLAMTSCGVAAIIAGGSFVRALRLDRLPTIGETSVPGRLALPPARSPLRVAEVSTTVAADVFAPDRQRPLEAYRLPFEQQAAQGAPPVATDLRLLGTVASPDGTQGFAMCQIGNDPPRIIRVGESFGGWTLRTVGEGRATVTSPRGATINVAVPKPGS
jgi:hypothetical protein